MKKAIMMIILLMIIAGCGQKAEVQTGDTTQEQATVAMEVVTPAGEGELITLSTADLALHNTESDCWIAYDGKVYDITDYIPRHPGNSAMITETCGTSEEFAAAFANMHGMSKVSTLVQEGLYKGDLE